MPTSNSSIFDEKQQIHESEIYELQGSSGSQSPLPTPASAALPKPRLKVTAAIIIPIWIALSSSVIIYNNYLYNSLNFKYPVFLVTFHLTFAAIGTRVLQRTTNLLDGLKNVNVTRDMFVKSILPIGLLFSGSLVLSNTAYLYLSVSYIQMLKVCCSIDEWQCTLTSRLDRPLHLLQSFWSNGHSDSMIQTRNSPSLSSWFLLALLLPRMGSCGLIWSDL